MVDLPADYVINATLKVGTIYKLTAPELISTSVPHYFIVIAIDGTDTFLVLCTSQKKKKEALFEKANLDFTGLVYIKPDESNGLKIDTFVNCNDYYTISRQQLINKIKTNSLSFTGNLSLNHYIQIKEGIISSYTNDLPDELLIHPDE